MATQIVSPSASSVPGMQSIDSAFGNIYSMFGGGGSGGTKNSTGNLFGAPLSGGSVGPTGVAPLTNPDNSLTGLWYNLANLGGQAASSLLQEGGNVFNTGMGVTSGGLDMTGAGFGTTMAGLKTLQPSIDFYQKLASGDPTAMTQALSPGATAESNIISNAMALNQQGGARGGMTSFEGGNLGTKLASDVGTAALQLQPEALKNLAALGVDVSQIGAAQAGIGQGVSSTGLGISGAGAGLMGMGLSEYDALRADTLRKMGINYQYGGPQTFETISRGLNELV